MNESSGKSSGSAQQSRAEKVLLRHRCAACSSCCCWLWFSVGVGNEREGQGADWIDHTIQMIAHGRFKRVFFRAFADRS